MLLSRPTSLLLRADAPAKGHTIEASTIQRRGTRQLRRAKQHTDSHRTRATAPCMQGGGWGRSCESMQPGKVWTGESATEHKVSRCPLCVLPGVPALRGWRRALRAGAGAKPDAPLPAQCRSSGLYQPKPHAILMRSLPGAVRSGHERVGILFPFLDVSGEFFVVVVEGQFRASHRDGEESGGNQAMICLHPLAGIVVFFHILFDKFANIGLTKIM